MKKKILIFGGTGLLGTNLVYNLQKKFEIILNFHNKKFFSKHIKYIKIINTKNIDIKEIEEKIQTVNPNIIINCVANTDLEYCEENKDDTYVTNTLSVENAVFIANKLNIPLLYISTAGIFDGKQDLYDDWDMPNPLGVYARSKYMGERFVCENADRYVICRAGWMMGAGPKKDKKFIQKLMKQILLCQILIIQLQKVVTILKLIIIQL